jgi:hypothetical protein
MLTRREALQRTAALLGCALSGTTVAGLLGGCRADVSSDWTPQLLSADQVDTLTALVDHLLPKSSTPGGVELLVQRFIDTMLKDYASADEQQTFAAGLADVEARASRRAGRRFATLESADKDAIFREYDAESPPLPPTIWGGQISDAVAPPSFYRHFKQLALLGYFASEQVGEHILSYDPIPGRFEGCVPAADVGNAWSLS